LKRSGNLGLNKEKLENFSSGLEPLGGMVEDAANPQRAALLNPRNCLGIFFEKDCSAAHCALS
jgi:hypothetical protein